jgi:predicted phosphodiesterase
MIDRRSFLTSATVLAATGAMRPTIAALQPKGPPRLRFGILSDIHITDEASTGPFEKALRKFDEWKADGVIACGDLADWGVVPQLERVATTWFKVFPGGRRSDGAKIENLMHYGDHDTSGYFYRGNPGCVKTYPDVEKMKKDIINLLRIQKVLCLIV